MSQNLTITTKDTFVIENLFDTIELMNGHLERVKPVFIQTFDKGSNRINDGFSTTQIIKHKRLIFYFKDVIGGGEWSEIKYGFHLASLTIYCGIWISRKNSEFESFRNHILASVHNFEIVQNHKGFGIELSHPLTVFVNDKDSDGKIREWFKQSFAALLIVLKDTRHLDWKIKIPA